MEKNTKEMLNFLKKHNKFIRYTEENLQENNISYQIIGFGFKGSEILKQLKSQGFKNLIDNPSEKEILKSLDVTFVCGNLGTGLDKNILKILQNLNTLSIGLLITPFKVEFERFKSSKSEINKLKKKIDTLIVVDKNEFLSDELNMSQLLELVTHSIVLTIANIINSINRPSLVNLDYPDLIGIFRKQGLVNVKVSLKKINNSQSHDQFNIQLNKFDKGTNIWVHIIGCNQLTLDNLSDNIDALGSNPNIMWSVRINKNLKDNVLVMQIFTSNKVNNKMIPQSKIKSDLNASKIFFSEPTLSVAEFRKEMEKW